MTELYPSFLLTALLTSCEPHAAALSASKFMQLAFHNGTTAFTCLGFIAGFAPLPQIIAWLAVLPADILLDIRTYRLSQNVKPLIWVECLVERHSRSRTEYMVKARSQFKERSSATNVEILLPLPPDAITPNVRTSQVSFTAVPSTRTMCLLGTS